MINLIKKSLVLSFYEMKAKNQNTYLGFFWYFLEPLIMFTILFYVKGLVVEHKIDDFIPYLFIGVIMVHFFISGTNAVMGSIVRNYELLNSRKIEPEVFVYSKFFAALWRHFFESLMVAIILIFFGYYHGVAYILIIPLYSIFILGIGQVLCVISTKVFDATYMWSYFCQILWFVLPIYYIADTESWIFKFNPILYFIDLGRALTFNLDKIYFNLIILVFVISFMSYFIGRIIFNKNKYLITERIK